MAPIHSAPVNSSRSATRTGSARRASSRISWGAPQDVGHEHGPQAAGVAGGEAGVRGGDLRRCGQLHKPVDK